MNIRTLIDISFWFFNILVESESEFRYQILDVIICLVSLISAEKHKFQLSEKKNTSNFTFLKESITKNWKLSSLE